MLEEKAMLIYKLPMGKIINAGGNITSYTDEDAVICGELVPISGSQLTGKIQDYYTEYGLSGLKVRDAIVNVVVPSVSGSKAKKEAQEYGSLASSGFQINGRHYVRLCAGSGQLRNNTVTFVWDRLYGYLMEALCCGITPEELGAEFCVSKWNAYLGLSESGMRFLKEAPRVCVISDYEEIKPHLPVDYIETECSSVKRNRRVSKKITRHYYDDPEMGFPPLNSFDGQGLGDPAWMRKVALELGYLNQRGGYVPSQYILRAPWCKGLVVAFDFKEYCREHGVTEFQDIYGDKHAIDNIDVLLSASQFKMWKAYGKRGGWEYHRLSMEKYGLRWGVVIANNERDDRYRTLNYQYVQALELTEEGIEKLCARTEEQLKKMCSGDPETAFRALVGFSSGGDAEGHKPSASLLQKAVAHNCNLLQDAYIQELIFRAAEAKFNGAKIGKLLCRGGYSFIVSDPVAQIQHIIRNHAVDGERDIAVNGLIPAHAIYSSYWNQEEPETERVVLMRSPLIDASEITVCSLVSTPEMLRWFEHIKSGLVFSIHDVNTLALQNCDFDGDRCFSSNDPILIGGAQENPVPILYPSAGAQLKGVITQKSVIEADIRGLNSAVGSLSNLATCLYALREKYSKDTTEYSELSRRIKIVSELVGVEIDKIKTGIPPKKPSEWNKKRIPYEQVENGKGGTVSVLSCSQEELEQIEKHNELVPDLKPTFMRYIYRALDRDIIHYNEVFEMERLFNGGAKLHELLNAEISELCEDDRMAVERYRRFFPALDTDCTMNRICRRFESLQGNLKRHEGARNMLPEFVTSQDLDTETLEKAAELIGIFQRQKKMLTLANNTVCSDAVKQMAKDTRERMDALSAHIRRELAELTGGDIQSLYNYLTELNRLGRCAESTVWGILDEYILMVIPAKTIAGLAA